MRGELGKGCEGVSWGRGVRGELEKGCEGVS